MFESSSLLAQARSELFCFWLVGEASVARRASVAGGCKASSGAACIHSLFHHPLCLQSLWLLRHGYSFQKNCISRGSQGVELASALSQAPSIIALLSALGSAMIALVLTLPFAIFKQIFQPYSLQASRGSLDITLRLHHVLLVSHFA